MLTPTFIVFLTFFGLCVLFATLHRFVVSDVERALLIRYGRSVGELGPGRHWVFGWSVALERFDAREQSLSLATQEITTADPMSIKASAIVRYRITQPDRVRAASALYTSELYIILQLALRDVVARHELEAHLTDRSTTSAELLERVAPEASRLGLEVIDVALLDVIVRGDLKQAMGEPLQARAEARAKLERARGEAAALRHLSNAAKLLENSSGLAQLRLLETLQRTAEGSGNSLVLGVGGGIGLDLLNDKR
jgi:regulator of protease activity HflC (stomatin/prohibitin superfamily)